MPVEPDEIRQAAAAETIGGLGDRQGLRQASTLTSAEQPQFAQAAMMARTPFSRMHVAPTVHVKRWSCEAENETSTLLWK
jgi:hypothetical protein